MKKRYFTVIVLLIVLFLPLNACQSENIMYLLEYDTWSQFVIYNENNDGDATFYVLESPLEISTSYGKVVIETCYYEYNMGFVMNYTLKTNRPKEIEKMANDAEHSLYGKASVKGKTLDITSYGYNF